MKNEKKMSTLIKPQAINKNELVEGYCWIGYSGTSSGQTGCVFNYSCGPSSVSSTHEEDDILL